MLSAFLGGAPPEDASAPLQKLFFGRFDVFGKWACRAAPLTNWMNRRGFSRSLLEKTFGVDSRRTLPPFARVTLVEATKRRPSRQTAERANGAGRNVVLFADLFTNCTSPERGLATLNVFEALGFDVAVSEAIPDGRAALSQGLIATARREAREAATQLCKYVADGRDVIVVEPSVLAMFRLDYRRLLESEDGKPLFELLRAHCFDAAEYVWQYLQEQEIQPRAVFSAAQSPRGMEIFYHSHCQQRTIGAAAPAVQLLRAAGFDVATSDVECCGMAGSFGYKKEFYDLSIAVGEDLFAQVRRAESGGQPRVLVATGTSCQEQLRAGLGRRVLHPMELLAEIVQPTTARPA
jgi:Fe-S oxidoreductase